MAKKILIYTDSRGQHTPSGAPVHEVFAERLASHPDVEAEIVLCPMKWTTTLDFFEYIRGRDPSQWDHIILFTGIVEWSPRPQPSAINDLYNNTSPVNLTNTGLNTRDYSRKVVNNKKPAFDTLFGEAEITAYLSNDLGVEYEGQPTVNMYGLDMARGHLIPRLKQIPNLIFINSNRFVPGWEGDFKRGRPANIRLTEAYSELFRDELGPETVIDLLAWNEEEIKRYTCDNLHLTREGSDWIYDCLARKIGLGQSETNSENGAVLVEYESESGAAPVEPYGNPITVPRKLTDADRTAIRAKCGVEGYIATLIIGVRIGETSEFRLSNLDFILKWIDHYYGDLFDVLLVEQDIYPKLDMERYAGYRNVRHEFIFNDKDYNRGWGYNVAVRHFTTAKVVGLLDTDVLLGGNFVSEVIGCHGNYDVISPYKNIYFTTPGGSELVQKDLNFRRLADEARVRKPTTLCGGIVIIKRSLYLSVFGFEQYIGYGGEDRSLDVTLLSQLPPDRIRVADRIYVHLFHESTGIRNEQLSRILKDLSYRYGCIVSSGLGPADYLHRECRHANAEQTRRLSAARAPSFGELDLYSSQKPLKINGVADIDSEPEKDIENYVSKELYGAGPADVDKIISLHNRYEGERCFIIGNGPSLNRHDLSLIENEYTFAVNSFFYKTRETGFVPTFFTVEDNAVMKENCDEIVKFQPRILKFFPTLYRKFHPSTDMTVFFEMNRGFYEKTGPNYCVPRFSTDMSEVLYCGQSVTYINLQIAYFLGFKEVYLIGMDFDYVIPDSHRRNGDLILSTTDDPNHFHKDYFGAGKTWKDPKLDRVAMNYRQAKLAYEASGRNIYNATIGGKLEIFERRDYNTVAASSVPLVNERVAK